MMDLICFNISIFFADEKRSVINSPGTSQPFLPLWPISCCQREALAVTPGRERYGEKILLHFSR